MNFFLNLKIRTKISICFYIKNNAAYREAAATSNNFKIDLSDNDFGKY